MIATKYPNRDALYASYTIYRDAMRRFIVECLQESGNTSIGQLISDALTRNPNDPIRLSDENEATEAIDIDNLPHIIRHFWDYPPVFLSKEFDSDRTIGNESELIKDGRPYWAHPGTKDAEPDATLKLLLLIRDVLGKIKAPDEKREVEVIRDRLFSQDIQELLDAKSNQLETAEIELIKLKVDLVATEQRLAIAEAGKTAAEEQLADISDIVSAESSQEPNDGKETVDTTDKQMDFERIKKRVEVPHTLRVRQRVSGTVKNIKEFGAFVALDGIDGLIHKSEMAHERINHPSEVVSVGDNVEVKVIDIDRENGKISLSLKRDPWEDSDVEGKYPIGSTVQGTVTSTTDYGVFLELEEGLRGMIHKSELSWIPHDKVPSDFNQGEKINTVVLEVSKKDERISLGLKHLEQNPWECLKEKYPIGTKITGTVVNVTHFGVFVEIEPDYNGLIRISAPESLQEGDEVEVIISDIDVEKQQITLYLSTGTNSIRQF